MKWFVILISAMTTFAIVGGMAFTTALVALHGGPVEASVLWMCVVSGLIAAGKDVRATMSLPPLSNGNYEAIGRFMRTTTVQDFKDQKADQTQTDQIRKPPTP